MIFVTKITLEGSPCKHWLILFKLMADLCVNSKDTEPIHFGTSKLHTVKPQVQAECLFFKSRQAHLLLILYFIINKST